MSHQEAAADTANHGDLGRGSSDDNQYTLSVDDAISRYKAAGIPRIRRTIQRYCSNRTLDAHRFAIPYGEKYLITPESLDRHIAYVLEGEAALAARGGPRQVQSHGAPATLDSLALQESVEDLRLVMDGHVGTRPATDAKMPHHTNKSADIVDALRDENQFLREQITVKDAQLAVKDRQIADQSERVRETNLLVASLHKLITPLIGPKAPSRRVDAPSDSGLDTSVNEI